MKSSILAIVGGASTALAAVKGFNYAAQEGSRDKFESDFKIAANLKGTSGFNSARLYTMIQEGTTNTPIEAIRAAIDTQTTLLLGLWASTDQAQFNNELAALANAINLYGSKFTDLVVGISVGSEDLYRVSPTGIANKSGYGQSPNVLVQYIEQLRKAIQGGPLASKPVGHVDTWNAFINGTNANVIAACDFLGLDEYPYFQTTDPNAIENGGKLFFEAYDKVQGVAPGKKIWVTEAGWPTSGPQSGAATASVDNAETFWQDVFCELERRDINTWWYTLQDAGASPSFGVSQNGQPLYDLTCRPKSNNSTSSSSSSPSSSSSSTSGGSASGGTISSGGAGSTTSPSAGSSTRPGSTSASSGSSGQQSTTPTVVPNTNAAGKIEAGLAALLMVATAVLFL